MKNFSCRFLLLPLFFALLFTELAAQNLGLQWVKRIIPYYIYDKYINASVIDSFGNYYIAGAAGSLGSTSWNLDPTGNASNIPLYGYEDGFVAKYDSLGNYLWGFGIGGTGIDGVTAMKVLPTGKVAVAGRIGGPHVDFDPGTDSSLFSGEGWFFATYDSDGNLIKTHVFTDTLHTCGCGARDFIIDADNNIYIAATATQDIDLNPSPDSSTFLSGSGGSFVAKYDSSWNLVWLRPIAGIVRMVLTPNNNLLFGGVFSYGISFDPGIYVNNPTSEKIWFAEYDTSNNYHWHRILEHWGPMYDELFDMKTDPNGFIYLMGMAGDSVDMDPSPASSVIQYANHGLFVAKYSPAGNYIWHGCIPNNVFQSTYEGNIEILQNSDVILAGYFLNTIDVDFTSGVHNLTSAGDQDIFFAKYDPFGNLKWAHTIGALDDQCIMNFVLDKANSVACIAGRLSTGPVDFDLGAGTTNVTGPSIALARYYYEPNVIKGKVYADLNGNSVYDSTDSPVPDFFIHTVTGNGYYYTDAQGKYDAYVTLGSYTIQPVSAVPYYSTHPAIHTATFSTSFHGVDSLNDFALQPVATINDLLVTITPLSEVVANENSRYRISYKNVGTTVLSGFVNFQHDSLLTFLNSTPAPSFIIYPQVIWNFNDLHPFETRYIDVEMNVSIMALFGTHITSSTVVFPIANDSTTLDNIDVLTQNISGSFDPNVKEVVPATITPSQVANGPMLDYTIHFQNTGNYPATIVIIRDTIQSTLVLSTFRMLASSHEYVLSFIAPNVIQWTFNNIHLPDSGTDEEHSHGFVRFQLAANSNLVAGSEIKNSAAIYFDYNAPVITNVVLTTVMDPLGIGSNNSSGIAIYPNPVLSHLFINMEKMSHQNAVLNLYDMYGRNLHEQILTDLQTVVDLKSYPSGVYLLIIRNQEGIITKKIIKQ